MDVFEKNALDGFNVVFFLELWLLVLNYSVQLPHISPFTYAITKDGIKAPLNVPPIRSVVYAWQTLDLLNLPLLIKYLIIPRISQHQLHGAVRMLVACSSHEGWRLKFQEFCVPVIKHKYH